MHIKGTAKNCNDNMSNIIDQNILSFTHNYPYLLYFTYNCCFRKLDELQGGNFVGCLVFLTMTEQIVNKKKVHIEQIYKNKAKKIYKKNEQFAMNV